VLDIDGCITSMPCDSSSSTSDSAWDGGCQARCRASSSTNAICGWRAISARCPSLPGLVLVVICLRAAPQAFSSASVSARPWVSTTRPRHRRPPFAWHGHSAASRKVLPTLGRRDKDFSRPVRPSSRCAASQRIREGRISVSRADLPYGNIVIRLVQLAPVFGRAASSRQIERRS